MFNDALHIELIEGEIIDMAPIGCLHAVWVDRLARLFFNQTGDEITVRVKNPLRLSHFSEPEPDLVLLRPRAIPYTDAHPTPEDVLLLVEVADTSILAMTVTAKSRCMRDTPFPRCGCSI